MFRLATSYALLLLALIPLLFWYRSRHRATAMAGTDVRRVANLAPSGAMIAMRLLPGLYYLALILIVAALARPQWGTERTPETTSGINIILAVDLSESMAAMDFHLKGQVVNRLDAVKSVVSDFITRRNGDRIGMVVFGSQAYTQMPLTRDYQTIETVLAKLEIGAAGRSTAIGDAIGISVKRLADIKSRSNVIILLTDGRSNSGEMKPETATAIARQKDIKIYAIGVGSKGRAPFLVNDPIFGQRYVYQQVDLDETTLRQIADDTGGLYFRAKDFEGLQKIYNTIDAMEKSDVEAQSFAEYNELYLYLLVPAFGLLCLWVLLKNTALLRIP